MKLRVTSGLFRDQLRKRNIHPPTFVVGRRTYLGSWRSMLHISPSLEWPSKDGMSMPRPMMSFCGNKLESSRILCLKISRLEKETNDCRRYQQSRKMNPLTSYIPPARLPSSPFFYSRNQESRTSIEAEYPYNGIFHSTSHGNKMTFVKLSGIHRNYLSSNYRRISFAIPYISSRRDKCLF